jgi:acetolactate synthase small subunit
MGGGGECVVHDGVMIVCESCIRNRAHALRDVWKVHRIYSRRSHRVMMMKVSDNNQKTERVHHSAAVLHKANDNKNWHENQR